MSNRFEVLSDVVSPKLYHRGSTTFFLYNRETDEIYAMDYIATADAYKSRDIPEAWRAEAIAAIVKYKAKKGSV